jgi:hypothetical protein
MKGLTWIAKQILLSQSFEGIRDKFKITGISQVTCPPTDIGDEIYHHLLVFHPGANPVTWQSSIVLQ